jgi:hypothetical protein
MLSRLLLMRILQDEALTRDLGDAEARVLVEWLVEQAEAVAENSTVCGLEVEAEVRRLCRRGWAISRFVALWGQPHARGAALQLAASERFDWPFPTGPMDLCDLMQHIVQWEDRGRKSGSERGRLAA